MPTRNKAVPLKNMAMSQDSSVKTSWVTKVSTYLLIKRQLAEQAEELKGRHLLCEESKVACYEFMLEHLLHFCVSHMAKVFGISRSGFYYWIKHRHKDCLREQTRPRLKRRSIAAKLEAALGVFR